MRAEVATSPPILPRARVAPHLTRSFPVERLVMSAVSAGSPMAARARAALLLT